MVAIQFKFTHMDQCNSAGLVIVSLRHCILISEENPWNKLLQHADDVERS